MALLWILMWSVLPNRALLSGQDRCDLHKSSSSSMSPWLRSLQCHNDYRSHVECKWKAPTNPTLQVWVKEASDRSSELCVPVEAENATEDGVVRCKYETPVFTMGINHTVFFTDNRTTSLCSSSQHTPQDLARHLRARPPGNLSVSEGSNGSRTLRWSSPYPPASSLNQNLTYQLSFRAQAEDRWTIETVENTSLTVETQRMLPGRRYEARVRSRAGLGWWSEWSPVVVWRTADDLGQVPSLHCVLEGEKQVMCSWEVSRELARLITYQLAWRHNHTSQFERRCLNPSVTDDARGTEVRYSCPLTDVDPERLQLRLLPTHNAKTFVAHKHIRPDSPQRVKVREENGDWVVEWSAPATATIVLFYQVWYYSAKHQGSSVQLNISGGSTCVTILGTSLIPLQDYEVKVRSLVAPGHSFSYEGIPSEWSNPVNWTSNEATWSVTKLIYFFSGLIAAAACLALYHTVPVCQKKVVSWVDSVPSPGKSKILSEIKSSPSPTLMQSERTFICSMPYLDNISTCSTDALLWSTDGTEKKCEDQDGSCWKCENFPSPADDVNNLDKSSMSFSGPYIFCQASGPMSVKVRQNEMSETSSDEAAPLVPAPCPPNDKDYVCLPGQTLSRSTEDLTSRGSSGPEWTDSPQQDQHRTNATLRPVQAEGQQPRFEEPTEKDQPSEYTSGPLPSWPQEGAKFGYCQLPAPFTAASK